MRLQKSKINELILTTALTLLFLSISFYLVLYRAQEFKYLRFLNPLIFLSLIILIPLVFLSYIFEEKRSPRIIFSRSQTLIKIASKKLNFWKIVDNALRLSSLILIVFALGRPQGGTEQGSTEVEGIDIMIVLDVSYSMKAMDMGDTRINAAKEVVLEFIQRRKNDRIGAVVFGREAYLLMPLTTDYSSLINTIAEVELGVVDGRGTAIGNAVSLAISRLRKSKAVSKVIVLLTDGANNSGNITPTQAAEFARTLGIRIYSILIGQKDAPSVLGLDILGNTILNPSMVEPVNPELLKKMSEMTGGEFAHATNRYELEKQIIRIDQLEKTPLEDVGVLYEELYWLPLGIALFFIFFGVVIKTIRLRRLP